MRGKTAFLCIASGSGYRECCDSAVLLLLDIRGSIRAMGAVNASFDDHVDAVYRVLLMLPVPWLAVLRMAVRRYEDQPNLREPTIMFYASLSNGHQGSSAGHGRRPDEASPEV